jgi:hypothetical protein
MIRYMRANQTTFRSGIQQATGFLYLHKISDNRITAPPASTMVTFERFCGTPKDVSSRSILVTTMWDETTATIGDSREEEIKTKYWRKGASTGFHVVRFDGTASSVWAAVDLITGQV